MPRHAVPLTWAIALPALLSVGAFLSPLANPPERSPRGRAVAYADEAGDLLPGTWVRKYSEEGFDVRRVLVMDSKGEFREVSHVVEPGGKEDDFINEGTWRYDGTTLKRKYDIINGQSPSRLNTPLVVLPISFHTRNEFAGVDPVHRHSIVYQRVAPGTEP
ncbi:MAG: hypothetical protein ACHP7E_06590 [Burkholderiales bacterium]